MEKITIMLMENQQQLSTRQSMAVNLTRPSNMNNEDEFEHHETNLNTTSTNLNTTDKLEHHETNLNTRRS